ncbi:hypothetical protein GCM10020331_093150 [Ectobacillus funiculus]
MGKIFVYEIANAIKKFEQVKKDAMHYKMRTKNETVILFEYLFYLNCMPLGMLYIVR